MKRTFVLLAMIAASCDAGIGTRNNPEIISEWGLTVNSGKLTCLAPQTHITLSVPKKGTYAINGSARGAKDKFDWKDLPEIWKLNPNGARKDVSPIIDRGLQLCEQGGGSVWVGQSSN